MRHDANLQFQLNHGLAFSGDGKTLYASTEESVFAYTYDAKAGTVADASSPRTVIDGMSSNDHLTRTLLMSQKSPGFLAVSRGSDENFDVDAEDPATGVSQIKIFDLNNLASGAKYTFNSDGRRLGWGLRNSVGIAEDPDSGRIYSVETSVDEVTRNGQNIEKNNPGEELNMHSKATETAEGGNYGYPYCYPIWDTNVPDNEGLQTGDLFSTNETHITDEKCAEDTVAPRLVFPAHTSPLNLLFNSDGSTLYISFRGSCKSTPFPPSLSHSLPCPLSLPLLTRALPTSRPHKPSRLHGLNRLLHQRPTHRPTLRNRRPHPHLYEPLPLRLPRQLLPPRRPRLRLPGPPLGLRRQHRGDLCSQETRRRCCPWRLRLEA